MKKTQIVRLTAVLIIATLQVQAATVAQWDFETGVNGVPYSGQAFSSNGVVDVSGNGNTIHGWDVQYGPSYTNLTVDGSTLASYHNGGQDGYTSDAPLNFWTPETWTIETTVRLDALGSNRTVIGKDGGAVPFSDFYLQTYGELDIWRVDFSTVSGQRITIDTVTSAEIGTWYGLAITCDGTDVNFWMDQSDGNGYQNVGTVALTGTSPAENALANGGNSNWTFGRGWWNGNFGDHIQGSLDNIRFSDVALEPGQFIQIEEGSSQNTYEVWASNYGISNAPSFYADADSNGVLNGTEYYLGSNPTNPLSPVRVLTWSSDYLSVSHPYNPTAAGVTGTLEWTTSLITASWTNLNITCITNTGPDEIEAVVADSTNDMFFVRLIVTDQPQNP